MMAIPKKEMMEKINSYLTKFANKWGVEKDFVVEQGKEGKIELRTDSFIFEQIYEPAISEIPSLMSSAEKEFGAKHKAVNAYSDQEKFGHFLRENGWDYELEGGGIMTIYKKENVLGKESKEQSPKQELSYNEVIDIAEKWVGRSLPSKQKVQIEKLMEDGVSGEELLSNMGISRNVKKSNPVILESEQGLPVSIYPTTTQELTRYFRANPNYVLSRTEKQTSPLLSQNRGQGGYFRHRKEHSINRRKAHRRR